MAAHSASLLIWVNFDSRSSATASFAFNDRRLSKTLAAAVQVESQRAATGTAFASGTAAGAITMVGTGDTASTALTAVVNDSARRSSSAASALRRLAAAS